MSIEIRAEKAVEIANAAGIFALGFFQRVGSLEIEDKGPQDFVSEADKAVEGVVRPTRTRIGFLAQPKSIRSIIDATQREQRHGSA